MQRATILGSEETSLRGCRLIRAFRANDARGSFAKVFSADSCGRFSLGEVFITTSSRGVLRGMHLQEPPHAHRKLVFCQRGRAYDVMIDLRLGSPTHGRLYECELSPASGVALLVSAGVAHGFLALDDDTVMLYCTTGPHAPESDKGVHWDSIGAAWPMAPRVVSGRDEALLPLGSYVSPFIYDPKIDG